ncbi:MAG: family 20 glycosylhydrolase [Saprospiraceae bacterium]|nr:family 20 glycosylhydrolase [Saprospiraceae bacterium]
MNIIPKPVATQINEGNFTLNTQCEVWFPADEDKWSIAAEYLGNWVKQTTGHQPRLQPFKQKFTSTRINVLYIVYDPSVTMPEGYVLEVRPKAVVITASTPLGAFYGVQTLRQLFPVKAGPDGWQAPCCRIEDYPRFSYRGMHLDVARHFFPVSFVKKYIDLLAFHKINTFHWHLTDDQGWRIQINKYPKLQQNAAYRKETLIGHYSDSPQRFDGKRYGGFYTQQEIKEVVEYAQKRFVTIVPEIEMPGHALAALSAYPELGCTGGPYEAATLWGVFDDVFCAGNDQTFQFMENVLKEVCGLFPGQYIHVGGDECPKTRWKTCPKCQKRMQTEGLKDEHELQSYFIQRAGKILEKYNKRLIGWDEILEGGLAPNATVMSWRGTEGGIAAARSNHDAIMTPGSHCYFDYYQGDPNTEPLAISGYTTLEKVYSVEPVPEELSPEESKHIIGAQANLWAEYIPTPEKAEYMAYPRVCALSEVVWSPKADRNWPDFSKRIQAHFPRLDALGVNYSKSFYSVVCSFAEGKVKMETAAPDVEIRYTLDGKTPTLKSSKYTQPVALEKSATVQALCFKDGRALGAPAKVSYSLHKASGKPYTLTKQPKQYTGGETYALTNGVSGGLKTWNNWVGLVNNDLDPVIDFGKTTNFNRVTTHFVNSKIAWIHPPRSVSIFASDDGKRFKLLSIKVINVDELSGNTIETVKFDVPGARGRYLKMIVETTGVIPEGFPGAGNGAWLFLDEIEVE